MKKLTAILIVGLSAISSFTNAGVVKVPTDQTTIQAGIDAASDGDTVLVADGTYSGAGNTDINFNNKNIIVMSENGALTCIIDVQDTLKNGFYIDSAGLNSVVDGFKITNGGRGLEIFKGHLTIRNCIITACQIGISKNGSWSYGPDLILRNNLIYDNTKDGIFSIDRGDLQIINNTIVNNTEKGINLFVLFSSSIIKNNIITGNGTGIHADTGMGATVTNTYNDVWSNTTDYFQTIAGTGDISADPKLDAGYYLTAGSPCIDTGDPSSPNDPDTTRADMGWKYYNQAPSGIHDISQTAFLLSNAYPNPFSNSTTLSWSVPEKRSVDISVYSVDGRKIATLAAGDFEPGNYKVTWEGKDDSGIPAGPGMYFIRLMTTRGISVQPVVLTQ